MRVYQVYHEVATLTTEQGVAIDQVRACVWCEGGKGEGDVAGVPSVSHQHLHHLMCSFPAITLR
jgi:hypothetical protein